MRCHWDVFGRIGLLAIRVAIQRAGGVITWHRTCPLTDNELIENDFRVIFFFTGPITFFFVLYIADIAHAPCTTFWECKPKDLQQVTRRGHNLNVWVLKV